MSSRLFGNAATAATMLLSLLSAALLVGCGKPPGGPPPAPGVPKVGVVEVTSRPVVLQTELPGRTAPWLVAEVRPQVGGLVKSRPFQEGSDVKAGALLYQIEPAAYQARVDSAAAALGKAEASLVSTRAKSDRYRDLAGIEAVSRQDADDAAAALRQGEADVAAARADLATQRINLAWTRVTAPISGRVGRSSVTTGALVTAGQPAALATVQQLDPIYVDLTQPSNVLMRIRRSLAEGALRSTGGAGTSKVRLRLEDGTLYGREGTLQFADVTVDPTSNAVTLRAVFPNPKGELLPGLYVRAVLDEGVAPAAVLAPQAAVVRDAKGQPLAWVVGADGKLVERRLVTGRAVGSDWLVTSGLAAGDRLVVEGLQNARSGVTVEAVALAASAVPGPGPGPVPITATAPVLRTASQ